MIPQSLISYIETEIIPRYKDFDKAHNLSHVRTVIEESLILARQHTGTDERLVYIIADETLLKPVFHRLYTEERR